MKLSSLLEEYITRICNCGDITVDVSVTSCSDNTAVYSIQLNGVMATEAVLLLVTNMQNLTEGLDVGIVVLFLQEQDNSSPDLHCDDQNKTFSSKLGIIVALTVIIVIMLIFVLISFVNFR